MVLNGRYRVGHVLGRGGMGTVYLAEDVELGREVAVKVLHTAHRDTERALRRLRREARNSAMLQHPNNVRLYEFCALPDGGAFLAMEYVVGRPLSEVPLPMAEARAVRIGAQICCALAEAHAHGLVHRDLKPQNVLLTEVDGRDFARVLDYGLSTSFMGPSENTHDGVFAGTVHYASPEQAEGRRIGPASDLYSVGVLLFQMLTGRILFDGDSPAGVLYQHVHKAAPRMREFNPRLHEELDEIVAECLAKDPASRPHSAVVLRARLKDLIPALSDDRPDGAAVVVPGIESVSTADALPLVPGGRCAGHDRYTPAATPAVGSVPLALAMTSRRVSRS
jgi:serine/threonine-protein kinase